MKKLLFTSLLFISGLCFGEGPRFRHKEPAIHQEFGNVYKDIRPHNIILGTFTASNLSVCIDSPTFCVDLVNNKVGIGTSTPTGFLSVVGTASFSGGTSDTPGINRIGDQNTGLWWSAADTLQIVAGANNVLAAFSNGSQMFARPGSLATPSIASNATNDTGVLFPVNDVVQISNNGILTSSFTVLGEVLQPRQPNFLVTSQTGQTNCTGDGTNVTIEWDTERFDQSSSFANSTFTAPVGGRYHFCAFVAVKDIGSAHAFKEMQIVTSNFTYGWDQNQSITSAFWSFGFCTYAEMDPNDTAFVRISMDGSTKTIDVIATANYNHFSGSLIN